MVGDKSLEEVSRGEVFGQACGTDPLRTDSNVGNRRSAPFPLACSPA